MDELAYIGLSAWLQEATTIGGLLFKFIRETLRKSFWKNILWKY